ncbi:MAG TPA: segregation/condensation protein A [Armatimonadota bacterium]|nr:segregation/condensation protein A [Armatimonadota bacterium]
MITAAKPQLAPELHACFTGHPVRLPVFEGPLDLLLHLINRQQIDIYNIPIARITSQYLDYLALLEQFNLEVAGEFLVMAATLLEIKSKLLLPRAAVAGDEDEDGADPRAALVERLLEYRKYQEAAATLSERAEFQRWVFSRSLLGQEEDDGGYLMLNAASAFDLWAAVQRVLERARESPVAELRRPRVTVAMKIAQIAARLREAGDEGVDFLGLFPDMVTRIEVIVTFLAVLEMIRRQAIRVLQKRAFGDIRIYRNGTH